MSNAAPIAVFTTLLGGAAYAVYYAHHQQVTEKQTMRAGVIRDIKRERLKKQREMDAQNQANAESSSA
ncbi:hypothetical protein P43SY_009076 [Pythium insidiosum]|uniref:Uncharacterized protein n=1 Tax=Pythium insidiosum TaxID=114742 RepID=A0AAD5QE58_PYTIN|nr:hypothetical protein P43SY_009076 [Pythium insidiosum]KAJ0411649.1 hypothetical protein ATCC90586_004118 [Pythium insidiosum]